MNPEDIKELQDRMSEYADQQAFEKLYVHFYQRLLHFACSFTKERAAAEEIVEDVFVKLWERREKMAAINNLQVYLFVAIRNRALNFLDWKSRDMISYLDKYPENIRTSQDTPESMLMTKEMAAQINKAVETLPPRCKIIFKMVREERLKYKEVAEILNISPRTVDTQMTIAVKKLSAAINLYITTA